MRRLAWFFVLVAVALMALTGIANPAAAGGAPLVATMDGAQEVPAGDPDGSGMALITVNVGKGEVCWILQVEDILLPASAAHIHIAPAGIAGPVVVPLSAPNADGFASGCRDGVDRNLARDIAMNPWAYYVNVHNTDFPAGAVRGQLMRP